MLLSNIIWAQDVNLKFGLKFPTAVNLGAEIEFENLPESFYYAEIFITSYPFTNVNMKMMRLYGADINMSNVLIKPLHFGFGVELGSNFNLRKSRLNDYLIVNANFLSLSKTLINDDLINQAFDVDLDSHSYPLGLREKQYSTEPLSLKSTMFNIGLGYAVQKDITHSKLSIRFAFEVKKTFYSKHRLYSDYRFLTPIEKLTDSELNKMLIKYGFFPSLNVYFIINSNINRY